jgi:hypothetical protein
MYTLLTLIYWFFSLLSNLMNILQKFWPAKFVTIVNIMTYSGQFNFSEGINIIRIYCG